MRWLYTSPVIPSHVGVMAVQHRSAAGCAMLGSVHAIQNWQSAGLSLRSSLPAQVGYSWAWDAFSCKGCSFKSTGGAGMLPGSCSRAAELHRWAALRDRAGWPFQQGSWPAQMSRLLWLQHAGCMGLWCLASRLLHQSSHQPQAVTSLASVCHHAAVKSTGPQAAEPAVCAASEQCTQSCRIERLVNALRGCGWAGKLHALLTTGKSCCRPAVRCTCW